MSASTSPGQPGWYPDPTARFETRYFDGAAWTQAVMRGGSVDTDPVPIASPAIAATETSATSVTGAFIPTDMGPPPRPTDRLTSLSPADAQGRFAQMLAMNGMAVTGTPGRLDGTVEIKGEPNGLILLVLIVCWIVPGIVYWYMKSKPVTHRFSLAFVPAPPGTRIAVDADQQVMDRIAPLLAQLPW